MGALAIFVVLYLVISIAIGLFASRHVDNSQDYILAGRTLPFYVTVATVFATWFGAESILGMPATFVEEGLGGVVSDPFGAGFCLIFVALFFALPLYRMNLLTIGDFFRRKYGKTVETLVAVAICISYLGWVAAQVAALGLTIQLISGDTISMGMGMVIGISIVMLYTVYGGMSSVAIMDFIQMVTIIVGLIVVAFLISGRVDGGAAAVINHASANNKFDFLPPMDFASIIAFIAAFLTMALGSIPQQDIFQRVMSSKNEKVAVYGTLVGGVSYILFCFIPMFIVYGAVMLDPELLARHVADGDTQRVLPEFIMNETPLFIQVIFFGALLSAIMSTASGTLLAPAAILTENILKEAFTISEKSMVRVLRTTVFLFGLVVLGYAYLSTTSGLTIFEMVENAYMVTLCGAFVPLSFGVYWKRSTNAGALLSIALGVTSWAVLEATNYATLAAGGEEMVIPPQMIGLTMAIIGMIVGSLTPALNRSEKQMLADRKHVDASDALEAAHVAAHAAEDALHAAQAAEKAAHAAEKAAEAAARDADESDKK